MMRLPYIQFAAMTLLLSGIATAQSLGEVARQQRHQTRPAAARVYTNDDLPKEGVVNVMGVEPAPAPDTKTAKAVDNAGETNPDSKEMKPAEAQKPEATSPKTQASEDKDRQKNGLLARTAEVKKQIAQLEHDLDIMNREFRLRSATFYADAGNALRDPKQWAEERRQHDSQVAEKQKALDEAKQSLIDLEDQARRSGVATP
ncbi:MAG TPA: hypothetical protein VG892_06380 [Terriglobales bacterium]|jgi:hypothetical protein|nr:hypothetical protein [Terriglobales bacterium]